MSSDHTRVSCREWQNMQERISRNEAYVLRTNAEIQRIREETERIRRQSDRISEENRIAIRNTIEALRNTFEDHMESMRGGFDAELRNRAGEFSSQISQIEGGIANANSRLADLNRRVDAIAETYNAVIAELAEREKDAKGKAKVVSDELDRIMSLIERLDPGRFAPADHARLIAVRESIRADMASGNYQAAIMVSQNGILSSTRLLGRLQVMNEQYNRRYAEITSRVCDIKERIERLSSKDGELVYRNREGEERAFDYDISFWSEGEFDRLSERFAEVERILGENKLTPDQLEQISELAEQLDFAINDCDQRARANRVSAIAAADTALSIYNSLAEENMTCVPEKSGYDRDDPRNPYKLVMEIGDGSLISVVVSPESPEEPGIMMEVHSDDEYKSEAIKNGVYASLENSDIIVEEREHREDCHSDSDSSVNEEIEDFHRRREAKRSAERREQ